MGLNYRPNRVGLNQLHFVLSQIFHCATASCNKYTCNHVVEIVMDSEKGTVEACGSSKNSRAVLVFCNYTMIEAFDSVIRCIFLSLATFYKSHGGGASILHSHYLPLQTFIAASLPLVDLVLLAVTIPDSDGVC